MLLCLFNFSLSDQNITPWSTICVSWPFIYSTSLRCTSMMWSRICAQSNDIFCLVFLTQQLLLVCCFWIHNMEKNRTTVSVCLKPYILLDSNSFDRHWCYFGFSNIGLLYGEPSTERIEGKEGANRYRILLLEKNFRSILYYGNILGAN